MSPCSITLMPASITMPHSPPADDTAATSPSPLPLPSSSAPLLVARRTASSPCPPPSPPRRHRRRPSDPDHAASTSLLLHSSMPPPASPQHPLRRSNAAGPVDTVTRPSLGRATGDRVASLWFGDTVSVKGKQRVVEPVAAARRDVIVHHVRHGETLAGIALSYGMSLAALRSANGLMPSDRMPFKPTLTLPAHQCTKRPLPPSTSTVSTSSSSSSPSSSVSGPTNGSVVGGWFGKGPIHSNVVRGSFEMSAPSSNRSSLDVVWPIATKPTSRSRSPSMIRAASTDLETYLASTNVSYSDLDMTRQPSLDKTLRSIQLPNEGSSWDNVSTPVGSASQIACSPLGADEAPVEAIDASPSTTMPQAGYPFSLSGAGVRLRPSASARASPKLPSSRSGSPAVGQSYLGVDTDSLVNLENGNDGNGEKSSTLVQSSYPPKAPLLGLVQFPRRRASEDTKPTLPSRRYASEGTDSSSTSVSLLGQLSDTFKQVTESSSDGGVKWNTIRPGQPPPLTSSLRFLDFANNSSNDNGGLGSLGRYLTSTITVTPSDVGYRDKVELNSIDRLRQSSASTSSKVESTSRSRGKVWGLWDDLEREEEDAKLVLKTR